MGGWVARAEEEAMAQNTTVVAVAREGGGVQSIVDNGEEAVIPLGAAETDPPGGGSADGGRWVEEVRGPVPWRWRKRGGPMVWWAAAAHQISIGPSVAAAGKGRGGGGEADGGVVVEAGSWGMTGAQVEGRPRLATSSPSVSGERARGHPPGGGMGEKSPTPTHADDARQG